MLVHWFFLRYMRIICEYAYSKQWNEIVNTYPRLSINRTVLALYGSFATTSVAKISLKRSIPSWVSNLNSKGSPTAIVVVGRPWYWITNRTRLSRVCSAGRYSMGVGWPDLRKKDSLLFDEHQLFVCITYPEPMYDDVTTALPGATTVHVKLYIISSEVCTCSLNCTTTILVRVSPN